MTQIVDIYECEDDPGTFVVVPTGTTPPAVQGCMQPSSRMFKSIDLDNRRGPPIGMDPEQAKKDIAAQGYHLARPRLEFREGPQDPPPSKKKP